MFSKTFITALALVGAVSAVPTGSGSAPATGGAQCCQNVENSSSLDSTTKGLLGPLLSIVLSGLNIPIGTGCTPIAIAGGVSCNTNTVNCGSVIQSQCSLSSLAHASDVRRCRLAHRHQLRTYHRQCLSVSINSCLLHPWGVPTMKHTLYHS
jgi:hypothetical protein